MRNSLRIVLALCVVAFAQPAWAEPQPGEACSGANQFLRVGGPENPGDGYFLVCDGATWKVITHWDTATGNSLFQVSYDSAACDALKEGRLRYNSTGDLWEYCHSNAWAAFGGGGGGTPAGNTGEIQFNSASAFDASANLTWSGAQLAVTGTIKTTDRIKITGTTGLPAPVTP